jgi:hypothetical protein
VLSSGQEIFSPKVIAETRWLTLLKRLRLLIVAFHLLLGVVSSYRLLSNSREAVPVTHSFDCVLDIESS